MDSKVAEDIIGDTLKDIILSFSGQTINSISREALIQSIAGSLQIWDDMGITVQLGNDSLRAIAELCTLWILPFEKSFDPRLIMRRIPDVILEQLHDNIPNKSLARSQTPYRLIDAEVKFRNGQLHSDWKWVSISQTEGRIEYSKKSPDKVKVTYIAESDGDLDLDDLEAAIEKLYE
jgi:hypothetical protein